MGWGSPGYRLDLDPALDAAALRDGLVVAASILDRGGVIAFPTETVYGLATDPASADGVAKIFDVKGRGAREAVPLIAADVDAARSVAAVWSAEAQRLAAAFWPGPLTLVVPADERAVVPGVTAGRFTIGIRVSSHPIARALASVAPSGVITSTSANRSGSPAHAAPEAVEAAFPRKTLDLIIYGGPTPGGPASTIVDLSEGAPRLIREGPIAFARVLESLR